MKTLSQNSRAAFTLVELLVVIAIIALLMSILLPSLGNARRTARTVACAANLRQIDEGMRTYAQEYNDAILGNVYTSGAAIAMTPPGGRIFNNNYCPNLCQVWDWASPVAMEDGISFNKGADILSRAARFDFLCRFKGFLCPENDILSGPYPGGSVQSLYSSGNPKLFTPMLSYNTASMFQYVYNVFSPPPGYQTAISNFPFGQGYINTGNYKQKISMVGNPSCKIFIADGGRWCNTDTSPPDYQLDFDGSGSSPGGHYADYGPWSAYTRAYGHDNYGGNGTKPITYSMRHGSRNPNAPIGSYRFNAAFFDGHVETLNGKQGLNPHLWIPSNSTLPTSECTQDAVSAYFHGTSNLLINDNPP